MFFSFILLQAVKSLYTRKKIKLIFSHVKGYGIFTSKKKKKKKKKHGRVIHSSFWITSGVFVVSLTDADPTSIFFLTPLTSLFLNKC